MTTLQIGLVVAVGAVALAAVVTVLIRGRSRSRKQEAKLPHGADAAIWSIVEAMPDPRNHLALTRDLTGEVRITEADRSLMEALAQKGSGPARREPVGANP